MVTIHNAPFGRSNAFNLSLALIEALGSAGLTVVSIQPSPEMVEAGARAGNFAPADACRVYAAMLNSEI